MIKNSGDLQLVALFKCDSSFYSKKKKYKLNNKYDNKN